MGVEEGQTLARTSIVAGIFDIAEIVVGNFDNVSVVEGTIDEADLSAA